MKRMWIGAALLAVLLLGGLLSGRFMARTHGPLEEVLEQAAQAALTDQWEMAEELSGRAEAAWRQRRNLAAAFADHSPMEEIDEAFAELAVFARSREAVHFAVTCRSLGRKMAAMADAHSLAWWNIL